MSWGGGGSLQPEQIATQSVTFFLLGMKFTRFNGGDISVETTGSACSLSTPRGVSGSDPRVQNLIMLCSTQRVENVRLSLSNVRLSLSNVRLSLSNVRLSLSNVRLYLSNVKKEEKNEFSTCVGSPR